MIYSDTIVLKDGVSLPASQASKQAIILKKAIEGTENALIKAKALGDGDKFKALSKNLSGYKSALDNIPPSAQGVGAASDSSALGMEALGGAALATAAVVVAVAAAIGGLILKGAELAISASEAKAKLNVMFDALGEGKITGKQTISMLDDLGDSIGQTREQLAPLAQSFMAMGVTGVDQLKRLTLAATSAGALAEGGGDAFTTMFKKINAATQTGQALKIPLKGLGSLASMGLNVDDVAKKMGISSKALGEELKSGAVNAVKFGDAMQSALIEKGAGPLQKAGASLTNVWGKFQENISKMFEDIDIGPFLDQIKDLFSIFGKGTSSGTALKSGIQGGFQAIFNTATKVVPYIKHFMLDLVIWGLKAYIGIKPIVSYFKQLWEQQGGAAKLSAVLDYIWTSLKMGAAITAFVVANLIVLSGAIAGVVVGATYAFVKAIGWVVNAIKSAIDWVSRATTMGSDFVNGLIKGITGGAAAVVDAVKGLADSAKNTFKNALGIHSPSTVMFDMGMNTAQGAADGMNAGMPEVHASSSTLATAASSGKSNDQSSSSGATTGSSFNITAEFNFNGSSTQGASELTEQAVSLIFERIAASQGL